MATAPAIQSVQCFGCKKTAITVTHCKKGRGPIKINDCSIELVEPEILRFKAYGPILLLGHHRFAGVEMRIRVGPTGCWKCVRSQGNWSKWLKPLDLQPYDRKLG